MDNASQSSPLRAGFASRDLTPETPCFLAGYPHVERTSTGCHDPLTASVLLLETSGQRLVFVSIDWLFVTAEWTRQCREAIRQATGVPHGAVLIGATHTHSGPHTAEVLAWREDPVVPPVEEAYLRNSLEKVVSAAAEALQAIRPVHPCWVTARVEGLAGGNRIDSNGAEDPEAGLLVLRDAAGGAVHSLLTVYGMHPTVLHEDSTLFSGDFIHFTRRRLRESFPGAGLVYLNGACGNQSPRRVVRAQTFAEAERIGTALGERMAEAIRAADARTPAPHFPLRALSVDLNIQGKQFPEVQTAEAKLGAARKRFEELRDASAERHLVRTAECTVFGAEEVLTLARAEAAGDAEALRRRCARAEIQVFLVGDCAVSAWPGEFFVEYALELKARSPIPVFPVTLANGELQGYVVTPEAERANGYESQMSLFPATVGARFVDTTLTLLRRIGLPNRGNV